MVNTTLLIPSVMVPFTMAGICHAARPLSRVARFLAAAAYVHAERGHGPNIFIIATLSAIQFSHKKPGFSEKQAFRNSANLCSPIGKCPFRRFVHENSFSPLQETIMQIRIASRESRTSVLQIYNIY